jgi:hypothetical protein
MTSWLSFVEWLASVALILLLLRLFSRRDSFANRQGVRECNTKAQILLASTDPDEIEAWLLTKEPYITAALASALLTRIVELKTDAAIETDWKRREEAAIHD